MRDDRVSHTRPSVLLVDDHAVVRASFRYLLENKEGYVVAEADSAEAAFEQYDLLLPDVVVLDISMPGMGGFEGLRRLRHKHKDARVLLLSMYDDSAFVTRAIKMGARGYISKNCAPESLGKAIKAILNGEQYFSDDIAIQMRGREKDQDSETLSLSPREFEVFRLLAEGQAVNEVAANLNLSPKTVSNHRSRLMDKLSLKSTADLVHFAIRQGVIKI